MSLIVEDGTGLETAEAFISVSGADAYFTARGLTTVWTGSTGAREVALRRGAQYLEAVYGERWKGETVSQAQALAWPRYNVWYRDWLLPSGEIPAAVASANAEAAYLFIGGTDMLSAIAAGGAIKRKMVKAGPVETETEYTDGTSAEARYRAIEGYLAGLLTGTLGSGFSQARAERG